MLCIFTKQLLDSGVPVGEANRTLTHAIDASPDDISLIQVLTSNADLRDGEALSHAIRREDVGIVEVLILDGFRQYDAALFEFRFKEAIKVVQPSLAQY